MISHLPNYDKQFRFRNYEKTYEATREYIFIIIYIHIPIHTTHSSRHRRVKEIFSKRFYIRVTTP